MAKKSIELYSEEDVIEHFYKVLADKDHRSMRQVHIPKSDVFYVREAIYQRTGERYTLDHVERAMYLEGYLQKHEVLDPERKREYE